MAKGSIIRRARRAVARMLAPEISTRGYDAASWKRFPREATMGRTSLETIQAAPLVRRKARYFAVNSAPASAAINALVTYLWGFGAVPAHDDEELVKEFLKWWDVCDADGRTNFGGLIAQAIRACIVDGEVFVIFRQRGDGLKLQLMPAEQVDESLTRDVGGGVQIVAGVELDAQGQRVAYWVRPFLPSQQFETYAPPVRVDAADVLHLMRPEGIGQIRGVSWLAPIMLKLADLGLLSDALLKGFQVAAMHAGFLTDANGATQLPFEGQKDGDALDVSLEPGIVRRLPSGMDIKFSNPQAAQQSIEFLTACIEEIAAGLQVPAFMVSGNVSRANYSSLRAALIVFKASLEATQFNIILPQLLAPIWRRWAITRGGTVNDAAEDAEWRFPALPEADPAKALAAVKIALDAKLMSRKEAIAARGESIERVDADIADDPHALPTEALPKESQP
ncbi:MAG TPA: phage portal protein [Hyphomonadaceae bacterium]|jgi:lambda family phage portal protein|nr:phage portal protein [Hyphomonadaceae bacterium]